MLQYRIVIAEYDPRWPDEYALERARLEKALGERVLAFEHIGSTSVPGLAAKPIIDVAAALPSMAHAHALVADLEPLGYLPIRCEADDRIDLWHREGDERPLHILHLMEIGSGAWVRPIAFRDALRREPALRDAYARLKQQLAAAHGEDIRRYGAGKTDFVCSVVEAELARRATLEAR